MKGISLLLVIILVTGIFAPVAAWAETGAKLKDKYVGFEGIPVEWKYGAGEDVFKYADMKKQHEGAAMATESIDIDIASVKDENGKLTVSEYEGRNAVFSPADGEYIEFDVTVSQDAFYRFEFDYYLEPGSFEKACVLSQSQ